MQKKQILLYAGFTSSFLAPLFLDFALNEYKEHLTYSDSIRTLEASLPHGKTLGQAFLTGLFLLLSYHFHFQNQVKGQRW